ncbi:hypothetical protein CSPHI_04140 [Corynebacterium sphenisci DSM 44792]|uniref:Fe/B12 periplasmic-binding domain-containing protein n=1 Tax=Corynebacterium sphenisci DSM 44792 TaxID=1437874 RepID=A0A1L7CWW6_9CORY|nr:ABC transporter substrate-binding protein [Corynebacterium sphenisci]APT90375.1 hypothetical protein CSPHI_04140 [Corynebacterium sphenisci DSM 44792]
MHILGHRGRRAAAAVAAAGLLLAGCAGGDDPADDTAAADDGAGFTVTDVAGRTVTLDKAPERVLFGESRAAFVISFLQKDEPTDKIVAWGNDLQSAASDFYDRLVEADPAAADIADIGHFKKDDVSVETLLAQDPDIMVLTLQQKEVAEEQGMLQKFDDAGLKYVFTDFREDPLNNTVPSVELVGKVLDREEEAADFAKMYNEKLAMVKERVAKADAKPKAFLWRAAGLSDCCGTFGTENLGGVLSTAGAENIADELLEDKAEGDLTVEKVISAEPDHIVLTGGDWTAYVKDKPEMAAVDYTHLGYNYDAEEASESFQAVLDATPGMEEVKAVKDGHVYGLYHQFYDSPFNIFALEAMAKWLLPEEFSDVDPAQEFADFHAEHMPFEAEGTFFAELS